MDFKIIAIAPIKKCSRKFLKNLTEDYNYYLCNNYEISEDRIIEHTSQIPRILYQSKDLPSLNICAIVGKNGSGKSSIIELLYAGIFNANLACGVLPTDDDDGERIVFETGVKVHIYFKIGSKYYHLKCFGRDISYRIQENNLNTFSPYVQAHKNSPIEISRLFYTLAVNYSHYGLNTKYNKWLRYLFHKNDGYQTPIVLNPFREEGVIDINNEENLTHARIAASLLTLRKKGKVFRNLAPNKIATHIKFSLNPQKLIFQNDILIYEKHLLEYKDIILKEVFKKFRLRNIPKGSQHDHKYIQAAFTYICKKLLSITLKYRPFKSDEFRFLKLRAGRKKDNAIPIHFDFDIGKLRALLNKMTSKQSHITFKLKQAINFVDNFGFYEKIIGKFQELDIFASQVNSFRRRDRFGKQELMTVIPPSFFNVDIRFKKAGTLQTLSSGEKQTIYSSASWMYHLINLASVREERSIRYKNYRYINLVFDEIELYYHPEMQRDFFNSFLEALERLELGKRWGINCIFITHSPFVLSDIHNQNILFLKQNGLPHEKAKEIRTFGANIHEMLKKHFLLEHGTIGAYAQQKIKSLMKHFDGENEDWDEASSDKFIDIISEPLIRQSLRTMFNRKYVQPMSVLRKQLKDIQLQIEKFKIASDTDKL